MLLVDASPETAALVSGTLNAGEWNVESVGSNQAALAAVQSRPFDVVITSEKTCADQDVDLLRKIRRVHPHTRVIILTQTPPAAGLVKAMRESAFSYLTAPFPREQFEDMLRAALQAPPWDDGIELVSATPSWIRLSARCDTTTADRMVHFVTEMSEELPPAERADLSSAFREMLLNAMEHGGHFDPNQYVEISYLRSNRAVSCRIKDPGPGFSMKEIPHAAIGNPEDSPIAHVEHREAQGLRPGGFGILLSRNLVDELIYNETGNEVILIKYLDKERSGGQPA
jgi:anti-sigma regulatory factor (Ser/Thr protein kinase)/ActR/RegA family two-component response regulator